MDPGHTVVRLGSISKLFTAVAVMQLVEQGRLALDSDVSGYLDFEIPRSDGEQRPITLRCLLSRQVPFEERIGGIASLSGERAPLSSFLRSRWPSRLEISETTPVYSNFAYAIAAHSVERASGEMFEEYLEQHVFAPLGMTSSSARQPLNGSLASRVSQGYGRSDLPPTLFSSAVAVIHEVGSTAVCATADDVSRFMLALLGTQSSPAVPILSPSSLAQMFAPQVRVAKGVLGLGLYSPLRGATPFVGHEGGTGGFNGMLALLPSRRFGFFVLYNSASANNGSVPAGGELLDAIATRYFPDVHLDETSGANGMADTDISGSYQISRRNRSTLFSVMALLAQRHVAGPARSNMVFTQNADGLVLQMGAPFEAYTRVPWWQSARIVVPVGALAFMVTFFRVAAWPFHAFSARRRGLQNVREIPRTLAQIGALLLLAALIMAAWLLVFGNVDVRLGESYVVPYALLMFAFAWLGVLGAGIGVWDVARRWPRQTVWARVRTVAAALASIVLALFCVIWRIAGTNLNW